GVAVRSGFDVAQIAWPALQAVFAEPAGRTRLRVVVQARGARHRTAATFSHDVALDWLGACEDHAARRHMRPQRVYGTAGFRTS
ncbi:MAG: hypothetical protein KY460_13390, partial [Actinobacteria bacterium]|nr:hypothetical protein [Actinomycetota bacterium]